MKFGTAQNGQRRLFNFISKISLMQQKKLQQELFCPVLLLRFDRFKLVSLLEVLFVFYRIYFSTCSDAQSFGDSSFSSTSFSSIDRFLKEAVTLAPHFS